MDATSYFASSNLLGIVPYIIFQEELGEYRGKKDYLLSVHANMLKKSSSAAFNEIYGSIAGLVMKNRGHVLFSDTNPESMPSGNGIFLPSLKETGYLVLVGHHARACLNAQAMYLADRGYDVILLSQLIAGECIMDGRVKMI
jgi:hypothetical protein